MFKKRISVLENELEERNIQLANIITKANLNPKEVVEANNKIQVNERKGTEFKKNTISENPKSLCCC